MPYLDAQPLNDLDAHDLRQHIETILKECGPLSGDGNIAAVERIALLLAQQTVSSPETDALLKRPPGE